MRSFIVHVLVLALLGAPSVALAHGGRGGPGGGGGTGFVAHNSFHPTYHAPTFSHPSTAFHTAPFHTAPIHTGTFAAPGHNFNYHSGVVSGGYVPHWGNLNTGVYHSPNVLVNHFPTYRPSYYGNWYHGNWQGHWGRPWGYWPVGWGGYWPGSSWGWGLGAGLLAGGLIAASSPYSWGYYNYSNPYWSGPIAGAPYVDYSQPMIPSQSYLVAQAGAPIDPLAAAPAGAPGMAPFDAARTLFMQGNYQAALDQVNQALAAAPRDAVFNEFRGLCLFALGDYQQAAAADHAVLASGPGWDWTTMSSFYPNVDVYTQQLRALEAYSQQHPTAADARFLLAYHYLREGYNDPAVAELRAVAQLQPSDQLAGQLLRGLTTPANGAAPPADAGQPPVAGLAGGAVGNGTAPGEEPPRATAPVAPGSLVGDWSANRPDGSKFNLQLTGDNQFTWKFATGDRQQTLSGNYTLADNYLILKGKDQNTLVGQVTPEADNRFNFRLAGNNPADPGLEFTR